MTKPRFSVVGGRRRGSSAAVTIGGVAELAEPRAKQRAVDEPARQVDGDEVEHQRGHDLVHAEPRPQEAGRDEPCSTDERGGESAAGMRSNAGPVSAERSRRSRRRCRRDRSNLPRRR